MNSLCDKQSKLIERSVYKVPKPFLRLTDFFSFFLPFSQKSSIIISKISQFLQTFFWNISALVSLLRALFSYIFFDKINGNQRGVETRVRFN